MSICRFNNGMLLLVAKPVDATCFFFLFSLHPLKSDKDLLIVLPRIL